MIAVNVEELRAADLVDSASVALEIETQASIKIARERAQKELDAIRLHPKGECHYCGNTVLHDHLFCDDECRADYVAEEEQKSRLRSMRANIDTSRFE